MSQRADIGGARPLRVSQGEPSPTIMAGGIGSVNTSQYAVQASLRAELGGSKPPYYVPNMAEIGCIPFNGLMVASTFAGCGGSCLGYRMAGFRVVWANEFVPAAQASYRANAPDTILDCRDIRQVKPEEILAAIHIRPGDLDVLDGSPPCQAFSTAGKREKGWGHPKSYEHGAQQCNETLFDEYIRILRGLMPRAFIAENVTGLVKGTAKGFFLNILRDLKASGYRVAVRIVDAQWLGVPQARQRVIFIGVREDLEREPACPNPLPYRYSVRDACPWIGSERMVTATNERHTLAGRRPAHETSEPAPTIGATLPAFRLLPPSRRIGGYGVAEVDPNVPCPTVTIASPGNDLAVRSNQPVVVIEGVNGFDGHAGHSVDDPMQTVQAGRPVRVGPSDMERRKFTIAELKRICAFPDDFVLTGSYAQQWERLGNSVPPVMMMHIARTLADEVLLKDR